MHGAAVPTGSNVEVSIERVEQGRQVFVDLLNLNLDSMHALVAVRTAPFEAIELAGGTGVLNDQADRVRVGPLR